LVYLAAGIEEEVEVGQYEAYLAPCYVRVIAVKPFAMPVSLQVQVDLIHIWDIKAQFMPNLWEDGMLQSISSARPKWVVIQRLLISFLLGLQFVLSSLFSASPSLGPYYWLAWVPVAVLLVAMLLSMLFDPRVRQGTVPSQRMGTGILRVLLVTVPFILISFVLLATDMSIGPFGLILIPIGIGLAVAFSVGSASTGWAMLCGLVAWFGTAIPFGVIGYLQFNQSGNNYGSFVFALILVGIFAGFGLAMLGSLLGKGLRRWALG
jgi:hypothetical protein